MVRDYGARDYKQEHVVVARDANIVQRLAVGSCAHPHSCLPDACIDHCFCEMGRIFSSLKSQVVSLQTAHSWANAGVLLGDACIGSGVAFEAI